MGMYDTIWISCECPKCNDDSLRDCQTKELENCLSHYRIGDTITTQETVLVCITECLKCDVFFDVEIEIDNGIITDRHKVRPEWE